MEVEVKSEDEGNKFRRILHPRGGVWKRGRESCKILSTGTGGLEVVSVERKMLQVK